MDDKYFTCYEKQLIKKIGLCMATNFKGYLWVVLLYYIYLFHALRALTLCREKKRELKLTTRLSDTRYLAQVRWINFLFFGISIEIAMKNIKIL